MLNFLGCLREYEEPIPFSYLIKDFSRKMEHERGLSPTTIKTQYGYIKQFIRWYGAKKRPFSAIQATDIDAYLAGCGAKGWCRVSVKNVSTVLRAFFRHAGEKGWCQSSIADAIQGPRVFPQEVLPLGPSWQDVRRLLASMGTERQVDIRDRAIIMLFAIYGLRASEVSKLRLEDIDWEHDLISVSRAKLRGSQTYPLLPTVGNAIIKYLQAVRPRSSQREVFITLTPPFRPISRGGLYTLTKKRMETLGINVPHQGPHSLRHACAAHLVSEGFSLKEIGDHLGHRSLSATRIYAKVNLPMLSEVASFDLGELL